MKSDWPLIDLRKETKNMNRFFFKKDSSQIEFDFISKNP